MFERAAENGYKIGYSRIKDGEKCGRWEEPGRLETTGIFAKEIDRAKFDFTRRRNPARKTSKGIANRTSACGEMLSRREGASTHSRARSTSETQQIVLATIPTRTPLAETAM